jgi:tetratricopeptide (TPR) repeat protein
MTFPRVLTTALLALLVPVGLAAQEKQKSSSDLEKAAEEAWGDQDFGKAAEVLAKLVKVDENNAVAWFRLGYALHAEKQYDAALAAHKKASTFGIPQIKQLGSYNAACVYAIQKKKDDAFLWLNKAVDAGFKNASQFKTDSDMDNLRDDPRFVKLVEWVKSVDAVPSLQVYNYSSDRQSTRATYFDGNSSPGQLAIDYGSPKWLDKYKGILKNQKYINRRWRFGTNFWTNLDTNIPLTIAGQEIGAGLYYLTLTHQGSGKFALNVIEPEAVRKYRIDPFVAHLTKGGTDVELTHEVLDDIAEQLDIKIKVNKKKPSEGNLVVRFGPHKLTAPMKIHLVQ